MDDSPQGAVGYPFGGSLQTIPMSNPPVPLIVPVYLNQRIVFDLLAMMQDGLSQVTRITTTEAGKDATTRGIDTTFGLGQAFAGLLKVDFSGKRSSNREASNETSRSEERVHTPSSLLFKLRQMLGEQNQLKTAGGSYQPGAGHIVEFTTTLRRNPLIETMDTTVGMMELATTFTEQPKRPGKRQSAPSDEKQTMLQMERFRETLKVGSTVDIVSDTLESGYTAVLTLEEEFLSDPTMSNLVEGQFTVLGKVIRVVTDASNSISLLRKTPISAMPLPLLQEAFSHFNALSGEQGYGLPTIDWEITGPAIQVLPIGIYA